MFDHHEIRSGTLAAAVALLALGTAGAPGVSADVLSFREGVNPDAAYEHGASEINYEQQATHNVGNHTTRGVVGYNRLNGASGGWRTVYSFDLGAIPDGAVITDVTLTGWGQQNDGGSNVTDLTLELRPLIGDFVETEVNWIERSDGVAWASPGGDFGAAQWSSAVVNADTFDAGDPVTFASTAAFVAAVQDAIDNDAPLDFILKPVVPDGADGRAVVWIRNDDSTTAGERPLLTITYVPEPAALGVLGLGGSAMLLARRRR